MRTLDRYMTRLFLLRFLLILLAGSVFILTLDIMEVSNDIAEIEADSELSATLQYALWRFPLFSLSCCPLPPCWLRF
ncbi:hypothetical protein [Fodinicurvata halophila]|uniref:hypothetical protein n=1 Tax=Fodinicurvata halophila TaxID=1419723 RepID=UPI0036260A62